jgi:hypothetical protein
LSYHRKRWAKGVWMAGAALWEWSNCVDIVGNVSGSRALLCKILGTVGAAATESGGVWEGGRRGGSMILSAVPNAGLASRLGHDPHCPPRSGPEGVRAAPGRFRIFPWRSHVGV